MLAQLADHMSSNTDTLSLIDTLYQQIMWNAFSKVPGALLCNRLKILHTLLCTEECVSASVVGELTDMTGTTQAAQLAKTVIEGLYAVLYVKDDQVLWYHASFPDFMFTQE